MAPLTLKLVLPLVQLIGAWAISRRISWKQHPALIAYLLTEFAVRVPYLTSILQPDLVFAVRILVRTSVVFEVLTFARVQISSERRGRIVGLGLAVSAVLANLTPHLTMRQQMLLVNQYYHFMLCGLLLYAVGRGLLSGRRIHLAECKRHTVYRWGMAAWLTVVALAGTFIKGGLAYKIFPYTMRTWMLADRVTYWLLIAVVSAMAWRMVAVSPRDRAVSRGLCRVRKSIATAAAASNVIMFESSVSHFPFRIVVSEAVAPDEIILHGEYNSVRWTPDGGVEELSEYQRDRIAEEVAKE